MTTADIIALEEEHEIPTYARLPIVLTRGEGCSVWDADGKRYLDLYGGHCVTLLGHNPPRVVEAIRRQAGRLLFYSNVVYNDTRARAAALLTGLASETLRHVFFCNSGTEANETALKLARKYTGRTRIIAMEGGFHGRTLGSLAVTWKHALRAPYEHELPETIFIPFGDIEAAGEALRKHEDVAAVILEPIQSMAGIVEAPEAYYRGLRNLCNQHGALLVFDEVQTGVGRTGTFSISEQLGVRPDLISLAKSLGSGIPVGAVLVSDEIALMIEPGDQGTTFGGGMMAMAAVEATLQTLVEEALMSRAEALFEHVRQGLDGLVHEVRGRGGLIGLVLDQQASRVRAFLLERGILTGGSDDPSVIRLMPPINTPFEALDEFFEQFEQAMERIPSNATGHAPPNAVGKTRPANHERQPAKAAGAQPIT